ncbi:acidic ribosomal protein P1, putative [Pediculus humanus corporis]|uniref:Large ribosomal subunit protein P2 n=1 Tax=Pediculus humanus subsp. corporis TaxID=121224 RepID=E0VD42_PEDHC|nr:acidic ribosomal protein P1, putative [Pediculus humanus corporis]EEB11298.1 acidic ribosomal protein P1, putative [Pediculus humanus corporis]
MRYVAAYLLTVLGGKDSPVAADIEKVLSSVGIEAEAEKLKKKKEEKKEAKKEEPEESDDDMGFGLFD